MSEISRENWPGIGETAFAGGANPAWRPKMLPRSALLAVLVPVAFNTAASAAPSDRAADLALVNRLSWGETAQGDTMGGLSREAWLRAQLHPGTDDGLPPQVQAMIARLEISQKPLEQIAVETRDLQLDLRDARRQNKAGDDNNGKADLKGLIKPYRQKLVSLAVQTQARALLRDLYSRTQLKEQLPWFWVNHFNVYARKREIAALVGDYEETAIRPHALGKFRDLLAATAFHPAMIQYLDNQQNAADKINENYAREIMELHTMGVGSGYSQADVQELARILTGVGVNLSGHSRAGARFARPGY